MESVTRRGIHRETWGIMLRGGMGTWTKGYPHGRGAIRFAHNLKIF